MKGDLTIDVDSTWRTRRVANVYSCPYFFFGRTDSTHTTRHEFYSIPLVLLVNTGERNRIHPVFFLSTNRLARGTNEIGTVGGSASSMRGWAVIEIEMRMKGSRILRVWQNGAGRPNAEQVAVSAATTERPVGESDDLSPRLRAARHLIREPATLMGRTENYDPPRLLSSHLRVPGRR